ncbi:hypothetical protein ACN9M1_20575 [Ralstonia sp. R-29]|uniref:hypothetical protein n=1 Tax=Ralstonia sp. R-29 TaxID=3404059 RepID=UPI003CF5D258
MKRVALIATASTPDRHVLRRTFAVAALAGGCCLATPACAQSRSIDIHDNPTPKRGYEVTLEVHQPPGPFDGAARGWVLYRVGNSRCLPLTPLEGATLFPEKTIAFNVTRVSASVYRGTVFLDRLQDQDYYGLGICHWTINTLGIELLGNGVKFNTAMSGSELLAGKPVTTYYVVADYQGALDHADAVGFTNRTLFRTTPPGGIFDMTLTARPSP